MNVAVIGLGRVGLPAACFFVLAGHQVSGYDESVPLMGRLVAGDNPMPYEPRVEGAYQKIRFSETLEEAVAGADVAYIIVPTPQRGSSLLTSAVESVVTALEDTPCLKIVASTLDPRTAGRVCTGPQIVYNPPLIRLGHVVDDLESQSVLLLGSVSYGAGEPVVRSLWGWGMEREGRLIQSDPMTIAFAKLAINVSLSAKIAWANEIDALCRYYGADADKVLDAVGSDPRIGSKYLNSGWPPSGPCLPRDMAVWGSLGNTPMAHAAQGTHTTRTNEILEQATKWVNRWGLRRVVGILGLVYNPGAGDLTQSQGWEIAKELCNQNRDVIAYDPLQEAVSRTVDMYRLVRLAKTVQDVLDEADVIIIATPWPEFDALRTSKPVLNLGVRKSW